MMTKNVMWASVLLLLLLHSLVSAFECNNLKKFACKKGKKGRANGCTWKKDKFEQYGHFPEKKKLFGICVNAGQSESEFFGTSADRCDCGTKCRRKCRTKRGYKKKCYWAGPTRGGTCLPNRHFADSGGSGYQLNDTTLTAAVSAWKLDENTAATTYGDISTWDTSEVTDMESTFELQSGTWSLTGDISKWDTSKVTSMVNTFKKAKFNCDISKWDVSEVTSMENIFQEAKVFNGDLSKWDTSKVTNMLNIFMTAEAFNADLSKWDTLEVIDIETAFYKGKKFNRDLSKWDTSKVTSMGNTFQYASLFNGNISTWDTSKVTNMGSMFSNAYSFNGDISEWTTSEVTNMRSMFETVSQLTNFNGDLSKWDTSKVTSMVKMFKKAKVFNADLSKWVTSQVSNSGGATDMFTSANAFNCTQRPSGLAAADSGCSRA